MQEVHPHLILNHTPEGKAFTSRIQGGGKPFERPPRDQRAHSRKLKADLDDAMAGAARLGLGAEPVLVLAFALVPNATKVVQSLERAGTDWTLLNVDYTEDRIRVVVRLPVEKRKLLVRILNSYVNKGRHADLVSAIDGARLAVKEDLWTDSRPFPSDNSERWWEFWLYHKVDGVVGETVSAFNPIAAEAGIQLKQRTIHFPDRVVILARCRASQFAAVPRLLLHLAEIRSAKELATDYVAVEASFAASVIDDAVGRLVGPSSDAPSVCLLDTGVAQGHPLLTPLLAEEDMHTINAEWGVADRDQDRHGTTMAGIAAFGTDLAQALKDDRPLLVPHRLESVKLYSHASPHDPELYGSVTIEAVSRAEITAPERNRVVCLTVTADPADGPLPSSWSAAIDQFTAGGEAGDEPRRLVIAAAGNLRDQFVRGDFDYPAIHDKDCGIEDPGQSWNAVTVGAITELMEIEDADFDGHSPVAERPGDLTPTSRTSHAWPEDERQGWPVKPDIVMEGGNWSRGPDGSLDTPDDLALLTTTLTPTGRLFATTRDTSPATAAAARMAAMIWARYPALRPETVRGLMVHSARWNDAMLERCPGTGKGDAQKRLRCFGYGVPNLDIALASLESRATMIYEGTIQPYKQDGASVSANEMHLHALPWPEGELQRLAAANVTMRVTLSYFIQPSPGRRGWTNRHRYASHGLRFDLKRPTETEQDQIGRLSRDFEKPSDTASGPGWTIGHKKQGQGSLHSDWWPGSGAALAACGRLVIYPVTGWWRERRHLGFAESLARYSLIVSLETDVADAKIYTAIQNVISVPVAVAT